MTQGRPDGNSFRWRCICAYDGTDFAGWQKQPGGIAVQDKIEQALEEIFGQSVHTIGAGRTDAGVHACGQVFHFDVPWPYSSESMLQAMRSTFPAGISPRKLRKASKGFHALLSAKGKRYRYRACKGWATPQDDRFVLSLKHRDFDLDRMQEGASRLLGEHDFSSFSAKRRGLAEQNAVRKVWRIEVLKKADAYDFLIEGSGFLYKMVRSLVGALLDVGEGKMEPNQLEKILKLCMRTECVVSAPAKGLSLEKVFYRSPKGSE